ncbi:MAG TPA: hypothetical protein ENH49_03505, partial [Candidatus Marinimicrobia bacterium]|nr:hypothetical protein [Candidatus Neomarinimicrobiota bacterium]
MRECRFFINKDWMIRAILQNCLSYRAGNGRRYQMDLPCRKAIELIKRYEPVKGYFVSFSGGKDSVVLLDLVKRTTVRYRAFFNITTVDSPELLQFIHKYYPDVKWLKPQATMRQAIIKNQYPPTRIARYCCGCLKECHGHGRIILTGIRRAESTKRAKRKEIEVDYNDRTKIFIHPLFSWSTQQIWQYIRTNNLSYCALYDEGFKRIGCGLCPMQTT